MYDLDLVKDYIYSIEKTPAAIERVKSDLLLSIRKIPELNIASNDNGIVALTSENALNAKPISALVLLAQLQHSLTYHDIESFSMIGFSEANRENNGYEDWRKIIDFSIAGQKYTFEFNYSYHFDYGMDELECTVGLNDEPVDDLFEDYAQAQKILDWAATLSDVYSDTLEADIIPIDKDSTTEINAILGALGTAIVKIKSAL